MVREKRRVLLDAMKKREEQLQQQKDAGQFATRPYNGCCKDEDKTYITIPAPQRDDPPSDPDLAHAHHEYFKAIDEVLSKYREAVVAHTSSSEKDLSVLCRLDALILNYAKSTES